MNAYTTEKELEYLEGLAKRGWCSPSRERSRKERYDPKEALQAYLSAAKKRTDWAGMNKDLILAYAQQLERGLK